MTGVQAFEWNLVTVTGKSSHGTTPMNTRSDAIMMASKIILMAIEVASREGGLATVGTLDLEPRSVNVIPNIVKFSLDVRHVKDDKLEKIMNEIKTKAAEIAQTNINSSFAKPLTVEFQTLIKQISIRFGNLLATFQRNEIRDIVSGAGHDSCFTSSRVPTSMIFIPSKDGVSHTPEEYSSPEEVENGFQVLLRSVLLYDEMRGE